MDSSRAEYGEKTVQKLNLRIDSIIFDLVAEKMRTQTVNDQLDETFELFMNEWLLGSFVSVMWASS